MLVEVFRSAKTAADALGSVHHQATRLKTRSLLRVVELEIHEDVLLVSFLGLDVLLRVETAIDLVELVAMLVLRRTEREER